MRVVALTVLILLLSGCNMWSNTPLETRKTPVDEYGVVCYDGKFRGEFSCVKVR